MEGKDFVEKFQNEYNLYNILNVHQNATQEEITQAYHDSIRHYPSEQNMDAYHILENAFKTLSDEEKRRTFDVSLAKQVIRETGKSYTRC